MNRRKSPWYQRVVDGGKTEGTNSSKILFDVCVCVFRFFCFCFFVDVRECVFWWLDLCAKWVGDRFKFVFSPDTIRCGWSGPKYQLRNEHIPFPLSFFLFFFFFPGTQLPYVPSSPYYFSITRASGKPGKEVVSQHRYPDSIFASSSWNSQWLYFVTQRN